MQDKETKRIQNLVVRLGDEGKSHFKRDLLKFSELINSLSNSQPNISLVFQNMRDSIQLIPGKAFIYAAAVTILQPNFSEDVEKMIDLLFEDFKRAVEKNQELQAVNTVQFFSELALLGLLNAFTFISILMDLIFAAENTKERFNLIVRAVLEAIVIIKTDFIEKHSLEFKNLIDDLNRLFEEAKKTFTINFGYEQNFYESLMIFQDSEKRFCISSTDVLELIKAVRPIRKNFKFVIQKPFQNEHEKPDFFVLPLTILRNKIEGVSQKNGLLNAYLINSLFSRFILAFEKNIHLLLDKIFAIDYMGNFELKNYVLLDQIFSFLLKKEKSSRNDNAAFCFKILSELYQQPNFSKIIESSFSDFSNFIESNIEAIPLKSILVIIDIFALLNFQMNESLVLTFSENFKHLDYLNFLISYMNQKALSFNTNPSFLSSQISSRQFKQLFKRPGKQYYLRLLSRVFFFGS